MAACTARVSAVLSGMGLPRMRALLPNSWLIASSPRRLPSAPPARGKKVIPSWPIPTRRSGSPAPGGPPGSSGSPHGIVTL